MWRRALLGWMLVSACACAPLGDTSDTADVLVDAQIETELDARADRADITTRAVAGVTVPQVLLQSPSRRTYKTASAFRSAFGALPTNVNFAKDWVVFYAAGTWPTGGYSARVTRVRTTDSGATLKVTTSLESPAPECAASAPATRPYALVAFRAPTPRPSATRYYRADTTRACGSTCETVGPTDLTTLRLDVRATVRGVYFAPRDRAWRPCVNEHLDAYVRIARDFFRDELRAEHIVNADGQGKTFRYETRADGRWRVVYMRGERDAAWYQSQSDPAGAAMAEILRRIPETFHRENVTVYVYDLAVVEARRVRFSGNGGSGAPWEGPGAGYVLQGAHFLGMGFNTLASRAQDQPARFLDGVSSGIEDWTVTGEWRVLTRGEYASNMVGAAVHELGHAFYLEHVFTDYDGDGIETNLMGNGFRRFGGRFTPQGPQPHTRLGRESAAALGGALLFNPPH